MKKADDKYKRKVSIGLSEPKELEENTIYITLTLNQNHTMNATAISNKEFKFQRISRPEPCIGETIFPTSGTKDSTLSDSISKSICHDKPIEYIEYLLEMNNGQADYSRLIKEGSKAHSLLEVVRNTVLEKEET